MSLSLWFLSISIFVEGYKDCRLEMTKMEDLLLRSQICAKLLLVNVLLGRGSFKWRWSPKEAVMAQHQTNSDPLSTTLGTVSPDI